MNGLTLSFENQPITVLTDDRGAPWWVASEVCSVLDLGNPRSSLALLDDDEKGVRTVDTPGGAQQKTTINESGLYSLILRSRKPEAKRFKKWVTSEVLPSIRRTGQYTAPSASPQAIMPDLAQMTAAMTQMMAPFIQAQMGVVRELTDLVLKLKQPAEPALPAPKEVVLIDEPAPIPTPAKPPLPAPQPLRPRASTVDEALRALRESGEGVPSWPDAEEPYLAFEPHDLERITGCRNLVSTLAAQGALLLDYSDRDRSPRLLRRVRTGAGERKRMVCIRAELLR